MQTEGGYWVGWDGGAHHMPTRIPALGADLLPVGLTKTEVGGYYHGFSNRTIWPLFHDLVKEPVFDRGWWRRYEVVNEKFADAVTGLVEKTGDTLMIWVHDYHLMLLPGLLRERLGDIPIAFFLHTPWPPPELFARLPWREEILRGLIGADLVSFHTDRYRKNFVRTCNRLLHDAHIGAEAGRIQLSGGRIVQTGANPISIDVDEFAEEATGEAAEKELRRLARQFSHRRVLVGVDRLDYTKGILERLNAFELLLERREDLRGQLALVQIAIPSRGQVTEYRELRGAIEQAIGRINGRFTEPGGEVPLYYLHRGVPRHRLLAYYRLADVFLVTALKDGMNLVSKEYVVTQAATGGSGALVLSEFAGASLELTEAIACNPFDTEGLAARIEEALELGDDDCRKRLEAMARWIRSNDIFSWAETEMDRAWTAGRRAMRLHPHRDR